MSLQEEIRKEAEKYSMCFENCEISCSTFEEEDEKIGCCNKCERDGFQAGANFALEKAFEWIKVSDELPPLRDNYYQILLKNKYGNIEVFKMLSTKEDYEIIKRFQEWRYLNKEDWE